MWTLASGETVTVTIAVDDSIETDHPAVVLVVSGEQVDPATGLGLGVVLPPVHSTIYHAVIQERGAAFVEASIATIREAALAKWSGHFAAQAVLATLPRVSPTPAIPTLPRATP